MLADHVLLLFCGVGHQFAKRRMLMVLR